METKKVITDLTKEELMNIFGGNCQYQYVLIRIGNKLMWVRTSTTVEKVT